MGEMQNCGTCHGTGRVTVTVTKGWGKKKTTTTRREDCGTCGGTGRVVRNGW